jgi:NADPH2:quinone reductase
LLLNNTEVIGAGWGAFVISKPQLCREIGAALAEMIERGVVDPVVGARYPLARAADALELLDSRGATGKVVLELLPRNS